MERRTARRGWRALSVESAEARSGPARCSVRGRRARPTLPRDPTSNSAGLPNAIASCAAPRIYSTPPTPTMSPPSESARFAALTVAAQSLRVTQRFSSCPLTPRVVGRVAHHHAEAARPTLPPFLIWLITAAPRLSGRRSVPRGSRSGWRSRFSRSPPHSVTRGPPSCLD